jgi:hypothetical protein
MNILNVLIKFFKRTINMETYLVTIDTTFANKLGKSIQNYGFCLASDSNQARERFLMPLRNRVPPQVLGELFPYVYAYKLSEITGNLNEQNPIWSYVATSNSKSVGQQVKSPFMSQAFEHSKVEAPVSTSEPTITTVVPPIPAPAIVEEFKAPEGVTDPVQLAMLKTMFDMAREIKTLKTNQAAGSGPSKTSVEDLEARFRAPAVAGDRGLDPHSIPIPQVNGLIELPKGKIDSVTLQRLRANIVKTRLEDMEEQGGFGAGTN